MDKNIEETIPLNTILSNYQNDYRVEKYFNSNNKIKTIGRFDRNVPFDIISRFEYNEVVQLLIPNHALASFENISSQQLTLNHLLNTEQIQKLIWDNSNLDNFEDHTQNNDYIESSLNRDYLIKQAKELRAQIDLYKTYDNQHHFVTKLLIEIIEYYINQYLVQQEHFSEEDTLNIENYFQKAIEEQNYLKYFIKAYTLTNNFHHVLNKHLALYFLHYFNTPSYSSMKTNHRLINCLAHIVTLLIYHPDIHKYRFNGITYRGLLMKQNHLKSYSIGNHILNKSFVSTSKNRSVAQLFADFKQQNDQDFMEIPVLLKYTIKNNETGIDIENLSMVRDEEEVLILPFSVFEVTNRIENCSDTSTRMFIEIDLEECQQTDYQEQISKFDHTSNILL